MTNIWEEAYSKHKEGNQVPVQPPPSQEPSGSSNTHHFVSPPAPGDSFEELYHQIGQSRQSASLRFSQEPPLETAHETPAETISPSQPNPAQPAHTFEPASSKSSKMRFSPRILTDKLSTPYPAILSKMSNQLSDIWGNILVETKQSVETLLVCGATRKEGNTFISFHLAMFLSKEYNMKILYVDTNPNHAVIPKIKNLPGFYTFVSEKKELSSLIVQTEYPGLYLLPSGSGKSSKNDGTAMLSREPIEALIQYCRHHFDITIIDGQPITMSPVMIEFARVVDMTTLVCRYGYSRREVSKMAIDKLQKFGVHSIGVILNDRQFPIPQKLYSLMG
jgi:Mrp family chromosome partitioning ATPase